MTILLLIDAYIIGSIPFGLIIMHVAGQGDIRTMGSGNIGATNVLRSGNKNLAALTLLCDMGKGFLAVWAVSRYCFTFGGDTLYIYPLVPFAATLGHCYPVWLKFKGGKGVATALGAMLGFIYPLPGLIVAVIWCVVFAQYRISSLAALVAFAALPFVGLAFYVPLITTLPITMLIFWRHRENIKRLRNGTELGFRKTTA